VHVSARTVGLAMIVIMHMGFMIVRRLCAA